MHVLGRSVFADTYIAPAEKIVDYAEEQKIELIVMPSTGRTGVSRFFMGSISEKVICHAHCSVLVLKR